MKVIVEAAVEARAEAANANIRIITAVANMSNTIEEASMHNIYIFIFLSSSNDNIMLRLQKTTKWQLQ